MMKIAKSQRWLTLALMVNLVSFSAVAHEHSAKSSVIEVTKPVKGEATYLGNEGMMLQSGDSKILFDPFFHNSFGYYQLVSENVREAIFKGLAPYADIDAIFISHAHEDHFSATDMRRFLTAQPHAIMIAPRQAVAALAKLADTKPLMSRVKAVTLAFGDKPWSYQLPGLQIDAVRIAHSGWPARANIENIVFRVRINDAVTIMHMGDADADDQHFKPYASHWMEKVTDTAFPPYWFFASKVGQQILSKRINAKHHVGVHVPVNVPPSLAKKGVDYFSKPLEKRVLGQN